MTRMVATRLAASLALIGSVVWPSSSMAQCNSNCSVGALGQGGASSGGAAQGFHYNGPGSQPEYDVTNVGNSNAGHVSATLDGEDAGALDGTYHDGVCIGLATGVFGDYQGRDPDC